ncbi:LCP family protein [Mesobacillus jeotgali]|jgi:polyisoprenyl-teichoic acid--peptidoglycan teichoic acid transferase|uniref:Regulatory protein MsrR n=1 Tax=Mesobacillus jeotgali TaxID=129985 RepID=A0ABY9VJB6_9BACI|nr:LCP family protein [Mesobacillus jeotgali]WNF24042.1 LCP family protein [Mesobacillus jeotgali]
MRSERHQHKKKRKRIRWSSIFLLLFLLVGAVALYSYMQFRSGVNDSERAGEENKQEYHFNGESDRNGLTNILLIGSDARGEENSRADTIMIASYNPDTESYKLTSIMRDTYVEIPGHGKNKINAAFALGGPELLRQTIKENFDVSLQYYSIVDFEGFVRLIDEAFPEGVEVDVEKRMSEGIGVTLEPGVQRLDGKHLLGYVRFRQDAVGDFGRVERQQNVIKEVGKQFASIQTLPKLPKLVGVLTPFVNTNMDTGDILFMGKGLLSKDNRNIETMRIPVEGSFENQRVSGAGAVLVINKEENRNALEQFLTQ